MVKPLVAFPDAVLLAIEYLRVNLPGVNVYGRIPAGRATDFPEFIRVERIGGLRNTVVTDRPRLDIECWSDSEENAEALMVRARAYVLAMAGRAPVYNVQEVSGPMWLPDSSSGQPRYSFAVELSTRGQEMS